jgi:2-C-methyl-D-erythritol 2,4-cyclodiphosphate synthase
MHAITDGILGAAGLPDLGQLFPDKDPRWAGAASEVFLREAVERARQAGWAIGNVDATVIVDEPKLGPRKDEVRASLAQLLGIDAACVNVKGKTHERAGPSEQIEAMAAVLLTRP